MNILITLIICTYFFKLTRKKEDWVIIKCDNLALPIKFRIKDSRIANMILTKSTNKRQKIAQLFHWSWFKVSFFGKHIRFRRSDRCRCVHKSTVLCLGSLRSQWTLYFDLTVSFSTCHDSVSASSLSVCDTQIPSQFLIRRTGCQQLIFSPVNYNLNVIVYCSSTQQVFIILKIWFKCEYWNVTLGNFFFFYECDRLAEKLYLERVK